VTDSQQFGDWNQHFDGVDVTLNLRMRSGWTFQGGTSTGRTIADNCAVRASLPEIGSTPAVNVAQGLPGLNTSPESPTNPYCNYSTGWVTRYTALGSYTVPKIGVQIGGTMRSDQGGILAANWAAPNSVISPSLGRNLSNNAPTATVNLIAPGTLYGDRVNELDLRVAKILKFGRSRTNIGMDVYNIFNRAPVLTYNQSFVPGGQWLTPTSVLQPRFIKISAQIDF